jgi:FkbM family methyltransferase
MMKSPKRIMLALWRIAGLSVKTFVRTRSLQECINRFFRSKNKVIVELGYIDHIVTKDGNRYYMSKLVDSVRQVQEDYVFDDIREDDIVIDIGACIGGFSIPASRKAKYVHAVEPMTAEMLRDNIRLNNIENIDVLEIALGDGGERRIEWLGASKTMRTKTLTEIKKICGGCDFLKIDCEGSEWNIYPAELAGIRRIEMEVHKVGFPFSVMEDRLTSAGFRYQVRRQPDGHIGLWLIHATNKQME